MATTGVLLVNLGTPQAPTRPAVARYLRQFLMDPLVVDIPFFLRWILVNAIIVPTRTTKSVHAYQQIWTQHGSPLLLHSQQLATQVQQKLGDVFQVELAMRYGEPAIEKAVKKLAHCKKIIALPLFPQYALATTQSAINETQRAVTKNNIAARQVIIKSFYAEPLFIGAQAQLIAAQLKTHDAEFILFSYHGLPVRQLDKTQPCQTVCDRLQPCPVLTENNNLCYRAQCYATTRALLQQLAWPVEKSLTVFQSRLGRLPWIEPYLDRELPSLAARGIKRLAVVCPSFVADCLETLEEVAIRANAQWQALGGEILSMIPCVNATPSFVDAVVQMIKYNDKSKIK